MRKYLSQYIPGITSGHNNIELLSAEKVIPFVNSIPLYDLKVAAGEFGEMQQVEDIKWIKLTENQKPDKDLFACTVIGESMNKVIPNGSICLFRKYSGGSRNGRIVLAEHTDIQDSDLGSCYTVKEYQSKKRSDGDNWEHESIILKPLSNDESYKNLILEGTETEALKVIGIFERVLS